MYAKAIFMKAYRDCEFYVSISSHGLSIPLSGKTLGDRMVMFSCLLL
jgi:hypothetical protein